jgi:hypothetical protein
VLNGRCSGLTKKTSGSVRNRRKVHPLTLRFLDDVMEQGFSEHFAARTEKSIRRNVVLGIVRESLICVHWMCLMDRVARTDCVCACDMCATGVLYHPVRDPGAVFAPTQLCVSRAVASVWYLTTHDHSHVLGLLLQSNGIPGILRSSYAVLPPSVIDFCKNHVVDIPGIYPSSSICVPSTFTSTRSPLKRFEIVASQCCLIWMPQRHSVMAKPDRASIMAVDQRG